MTPPAPAASRVRAYLLHGVLLYAALVALACRALDETSIRLALRVQGRLSFLLFGLALSGPGLARLQGGPISHWLARQRLALLQAFAVSHLCHGVWILLFYWLTPHDFVFNLFDGSGMLTFPLLIVLLGLALPSVRPRFGRHATWLERAVVVYVWLQFFGFFVDRLQAGRPELKPWYWAAIALSGVAGLLAVSERRTGSKAGRTVTAPR